MVTKKEVHRFGIKPDDVCIYCGTAICVKNNKNFGSYIRVIFYINCYYNFNPCGIFEKTKSFGLGTRKINGGRKFTEIKVQKPRGLMFVTD